MTWNYRVLSRTKYNGLRKEEYQELGVHEVYYDDEGNPTSCSVDPITPWGFSFVELRKDFELMRRAFEKPVLRYEDF
jgi:hypothetical protein